MMNHLRPALLSLGLAASCASAFADPIANLDDLVLRCQQAFNQRPVTEVTYSGAVNAWVKRLYLPTSIAMRARKTPSVVSPYVAEIDVVEIAAAHQGEDEQSVRALDVSPDENVIRTARRINLAYQDGGWNVISGTSTVEVRRDASEAFSKVKISRHSREAMLQSKGPLASCLGDGAASGYSAPRSAP